MARAAWSTPLPAAVPVDGVSVDGVPVDGVVAAAAGLVEPAAEEHPATSPVAVTAATPHTHAAPPGRITFT
ncbi:MAG: hypothetical protein KGQ66_20800 [Acidobacteriota bacterium]|nr:hypothetical protein [Acidobacteriota bacterium]